MRDIKIRKTIRTEQYFVEVVNRNQEPRFSFLYNSKELELTYPAIHGELYLTIEVDTFSRDFYFLLEACYPAGFEDSKIITNCCDLLDFREVCTLKSLIQLYYRSLPCRKNYRQAVNLATEKIYIEYILAEGV